MSALKRKHNNNKINDNVKSKKQSSSKASFEDEFLVGGSDSDNIADVEEEIDPYENETTDEKRLRLAKEYLNKLEKQINENKDTFGMDHVDEESGDEINESSEKISIKQQVSAILKSDLLKSEGKLFKPLTKDFEKLDYDIKLLYKH